MKKDLLSELDGGILDRADAYWDKKEKKNNETTHKSTFLPKLFAGAAAVIALLVALPLLQPLMKKPAESVTPSVTLSADDAKNGVKLAAAVAEDLLPDGEPYERSEYAFYYKDKNIDDYFQKLRKNGITLLTDKNDRTSTVGYGRDALMYIKKNDSYLNVYVYAARESFTDDDAISVINGKIAQETADYVKGSVYTDMGAVLYAADLSPEGFYEKTSCRLIMCAISSGSGKTTYLRVFVTGKNDAFITQMGFNGWAFDPYVCDILPVDTDGDGTDELLIRTPGPTSGVRTEWFTLYTLGDTPELAGCSMMMSDSHGTKVVSCDGIPAVKLTLADLYNAKYDVIKELVVDQGSIKVRESNGELSVGLFSPENLANKRAAGCPAETDDCFDFSLEFDTYQRFVYDSMIDRTGAVGLKAFRAGGYTAFIRSEGSDYYILKGDHGERVKSPAYTLNLYTGNGIQYYSEYFVRSGIFAEENGIYKWDLANGKTASFISTKQPVRNTFRVGSMLYYVTHGKDTVTVKAADVRGENIYRIGSFECDEAKRASVIGVTSDGVYVGVNTGIIYFTGFDGSAEKLAEYDGVTLAKLSCDRLYVCDKNAVHELDENGEICSAEISGYVEIYGGMIVKVEKDGLKFITAEDGTVTRVIECAIPEPPADAKYRRSLYTVIFDGKMYLWAPGSDDLTYVDLSDGTSYTVPGFFE